MTKLKSKASLGSACLSLFMLIGAGQIASANPDFEIEPIGPFAMEGSMLHSPSNLKWDTETDSGGRLSASVVESEGVPGNMAMQIRVKKKTVKPWDVRMRAQPSVDVAKGDTVVLYFWARAERPPKGRETGRIQVAYARNEEPYDVVIVEDINPTKDWKMYKVTGKAAANFPADKTEMGFNMGFSKQKIQFGPFYALNLGSEE